LQERATKCDTGAQLSDQCLTANGMLMTSSACSSNAELQKSLRQTFFARYFAPLKV
jgi:hypothetical protein